MDTPRWRVEEIVGLGVAVVLHLVLLAMLLLKPEPVVIEPVKTVTVSLAEDVSLEATAPEPVAESRLAMAPALSDIPAPPVPEPVEAPKPVQTAAPTPPVSTRSKTPPKPVERTTAKPATRPATTPKTATKPDTSTRRRPDKPASATAQPKSGGASKIGSDFLEGAGQSKTSSETKAPARVFGSAEKASLAQAINRKLQPHWRGKAPQGLDADKLVTVLSWEMNPDGSIRGTPRVVSQSGITDANRPQAQRHAEVAIRAVQLAAPFDLPDEFYDKWKLVRDWRFDRRL